MPLYWDKLGESLGEVVEEQIGKKECNRIIRISNPIEKKKVERQESGEEVEKSEYGAQVNIYIKERRGLSVWESSDVEEENQRIGESNARIGKENIGNNINTVSVSNNSECNIYKELREQIGRKRRLDTPRMGNINNKRSKRISNLEKEIYKSRSPHTPITTKRETNSWNTRSESINSNTSNIKKNNKNKSIENIVYNCPPSPSTSIYSHLSDISMGSTLSITPPTHSDIKGQILKKSSNLFRHISHSRTHIPKTPKPQNPKHQELQKYYISI